MSLRSVTALAVARRKLRWAKEKAEREQHNAHVRLATRIAIWKGATVESLKFSNVHCSKAPADLGCVYVSSSHPMTNPCIFCGSPEEEIY